MYVKCSHARLWRTRGPAHETPFTWFIPKVLAHPKTLSVIGTVQKHGTDLRFRSATGSAVQKRVHATHSFPAFCNVLRCTLLFLFFRLTNWTPFDKNPDDSGGGSFSSAGSPIPTSLANRC